VPPRRSRGEHGVDLLGWHGGAEQQLLVADPAAEAGPQLGR
jgi:hypothetical protein